MRLIVLSLLAFFGLADPVSAQCPSCSGGRCPVAPVFVPPAATYKFIGEGRILSPEGVILIRGFDGVYRAKQTGTCDCCKPECLCESGGLYPARARDCVCYPCQCNPIAIPVPFVTSLVTGKRLYPHPDGVYREYPAK